MRCQNCGFEVAQGELFCGNCGMQVERLSNNKVNIDENSSTEKNQSEKYYGVDEQSSTNDLTSKELNLPKKQSPVLSIFIFSLLGLIIIASLIIFYLVHSNANDYDNDYKGNNVDIMGESESDIDTEKDSLSENMSDGDVSQDENNSEIEKSTENAIDTHNNSVVRTNVELTDVEEYIANKIRPIYYDAIANDNLISEEVAEGVTLYYDDKAVSWIQCSPGVSGDIYERRYFFDLGDGKLVFAFIFLNDEEYRMYFHDNSLIRYIDNNGASVDNPKEPDVLHEADKAIEEAYSYKQTMEPVDYNPIFSSAEASSMLGKSAKGNEYYPSYVLDNDPSTCWASDSNEGLNPSITLRSESRQKVSGIIFSNGYFKSEDVYNKNRRITKILISYEGGSMEYSCEPEQYLIMQDVEFDKPIETNFLTIKVLESKAGNVSNGWNDICISTIEAY